MNRLLLLASGAVAGLVAGAFAPDLSGAIRAIIIPPSAQSQAGGNPGGHGGHGHGSEEGEHEEDANLVELAPDQIEASGIQTAQVGAGTIDRLMTVPGTLAADQDRLVRVPAKVSGNISALRRRLGDQVSAGDVLAVIESREVAEAKSEYLTALRQEQLARVTFERERQLWGRRVSAEQDFLKARAEADEARMRVDLTRQRLGALGLSEQEVSGLGQIAAGGTGAALRTQEVRASISGRVIARRAELGAAVSPETELFTIADLSTVWVELAVQPDDLPYLREGQTVSVTQPSAGATGAESAGEGEVAFVSPVVDQETGAARVVARLGNPDGRWRPGAFVVAVVAAGGAQADVVVTRDAVQTIKGENVVFVRTEKGFERRDVVLGRANDRVAEVVFGLDAGETVATTNSFILKAQLARGEAAHSHAH